MDWPSIGKPSTEKSPNCKTGGRKKEGGGGEWGERGEGGGREGVDIAMINTIYM